MSSSPTRPLMRYHGGKWRIAPWIIQHFPPHGVYVEPFAGAASVFMRKPRVHGEVLNDIDGEIVNVFRVLRDPEKAKDLERLIRLTPFSREEFEQSYDSTDCPIERARRIIVRTSMGYGTTSLRKSRTGFRARTYTQNQTGAPCWVSWPDQIRNYVYRLQGVTIENKDACECIKLHDSSDTLFYLDPPYPGGCRVSGLKSYNFEMTDQEHENLLDLLKDVSGMVVLSGYENDLYNERLKHWKIAKCETLADGAAKRTECLWINPAAWGKLNSHNPLLRYAE